MMNTNYQLSDQELKDLEQLRSFCKKADGSVPNVYTHILEQKRTLPVNLMCYKGQQLIGFLSVFFFYDEAVEVALLVHPEMRRQGIAKQLLQHIIPLIQNYGFKKLVFSSPAKRNNKWLLNLGFHFEHSEFYMERDDLSPLLDHNQSLTFREATLEDIPVLCAIDDACFPKKESNPTARFQQLFSDRNYQILLAYLNNHPIGKAHMRWDAQGATLSDISILPSLQGKGLGTALIAQCINFALSEGKPHLNLDVETHNQRALNLYTRLGFVVENACDYWAIELNQLMKIIDLAQQAS